MSPFQLREAVRCIHSGGLLAYPTEAVYGLGCDPLNSQAVLRLIDLKQRRLSQGLILIAADLIQLQPYLGELTAAQRQRLDDTWPGPVTWLVPVAAHVPVWLTGGRDSIALRQTAHPLCAALCRAAGTALVSTSANPHGQPPARDPLTVRRYFRAAVDRILHDDVGDRLRPSEIRDLRSGRIVRAG